MADTKIIRYKLNECKSLSYRQVLLQALDDIEEPEEREGISDKLDTLPEAELNKRIFFCVECRAELPKQDRYCDYCRKKLQGYGVGTYAC